MLRSYPITLAELAQRAEVPIAEAFAAALGPLAPAVTSSGLVDLAHPAVLAYFAARPFGPQGAPRIGGVGYLVPAVARTPQGDGTDATHPVARTYLARTWGRVPTEVDFADHVVASRWVSIADVR